MNRLVGVFVIGLLAAAALTMCSCHGKYKGPSDDESSVQPLVTQLKESPNDMGRMDAADRLAKLPPASIKGIVPDLKAALAKERMPHVKQAIQKAIAAAGQAP